MFRGFNLKIPEGLNDKYYQIGLKIYDGHKIETKFVLDDFLLGNKSLSGTKIMDNWFPMIDAHLFLSHSHADEKKAITLAGILYEKLGVITFIDSCIWGYSTNLLKQIDDNYCLNYSGESYNYSKRNYSTSHVNLMLSTALNRMIDNCECIFFLNSPNSLSSSDVVSRTKSPWIFSEIATTQTIRKKTPSRLKPRIKMFSEGGQLNESKRDLLIIEYDLELSHLSDLNISDIKKWIGKSCSSANDALDILYRLKPIDDKFILTNYG
ncbi:hypothetical protein [Litoribacter populi]|uniref:hypothetical protein n=1 Tax=Litoribacter populi TaxID=2598460 RepID=UPI00117E4389|nr:hypothetical protein [Litoribacter populi]